MAPVLPVLAGLLLLTGGRYVLVARRQRRSIGISEGRVVYRDVHEWCGQVLQARSIVLRGRPDLLIRQGATLFPVEVKTGTTPWEPHPGHALQVLAYCLLVEENHGARPPHGLLRYPERDFTIPYTAEAEARLRRLVTEMLEAQADGREQQRSHTNPRRCAACGFRDRCTQALVGPSPP